MGQRLAACFFRVRNIALIRRTARSRITSGSPVWWYGYKLPHTQLYMHYTLFLSVPTISAADRALAASLYRVLQ